MVKNLEVMKREAEIAEEFFEKQSQNKVKYAGFTIPVRQGELYLAVRKTLPFEGLYSAIGGKVDEEALKRRPVLITPSATTIRLMSEGFESPTTAAVREFCEEMYAGNVFPEDFNLEDFKISRIAKINDCNTGVSCYMRLVTVPANLEFSPSLREVGDITKLIDIPPEKINLLTKLTLNIIADSPYHTQFLDQIPKRESLRVNSIDGALPDNFYLMY